MKAALPGAGAAKAKQSYGDDMGLLDNEFMRLVLSGSPYMQRREKERYADEQAEKVRGLIGQRYDEGQGQGMLQNTGLLGKQTTPEQFAVSMMGVPGYENIGSQLYGNMLGDEATANRQERERDYYAQNMTEYQRQALDQQGRANQATTARAERTVLRDQQNKDRQYNLSALNQVGDEFRKRVEPHLPVIATVKAVQDRIEQYRGNISKMHGADRSFVLSSFLRAIRPTEAQNEGDVANLKQAFGWGGDFDSLMSNLNTLLTGGQGGVLDDTKIDAMIDFMQGKADFDLATIKEMENEYTNAWPELDPTKLTVGMPKSFMPTEYYVGQGGQQPPPQPSGAPTPKTHPHLFDKIR